MTLALITEAEDAGARLSAASEAVGLSARTVERWRAGAVDDQRHGPTTAPANKLTAKERRKLLTTVNSARFRNRSPNEIVPLLADEGRYLGSESTVYRILREEGQLHHRERSKAPQRRATKAHVATGPNEVWSWDITYLPSAMRGAFFYLYLVVDVWSRKIVSWEVNEAESAEHAAALIKRTCEGLGVDGTRLVLHSDNGGPMKGTTMVAMLEWLGILASFSRPGVSDDNPFSEALFRTLKYRPEYPSRPFADVAAARAWVEAFVRWYNTDHLHSGIRFVTPEDRHQRRDAAVLARRHEVYQRAQAANPERWSRGTRCWEAIAEVHLNPGRPAASTATAAPAVVKAKKPESKALSPKGPERSGGGALRALTGPERRLSVEAGRRAAG